jgi:beta-N-acetylhexosaminidase
VLIDQEGGRVQRLGPPHWRRYPPGRAYGELPPTIPYAARDRPAGGPAAGPRPFGPGDQCRLRAGAGRAAEGAHDVIGDRAYAETPGGRRQLGRAACEGLIAGGVLPVIKHIPGHGRAMADSHLDLPVVDASYEDLDAWDFAPFRVLSDMPMAMSAHVIYAAIDPKRPRRPRSKAISAR